MTTELKTEVEAEPKRGWDHHFFTANFWTRQDDGNLWWRHESPMYGCCHVYVIERVENGYRIKAGYHLDDPSDFDYVDKRVYASELIAFRALCFLADNQRAEHLLVEALEESERAEEMLDRLLDEMCVEVKR